LLGAVIVHPDNPKVLPLFPEAITRQDGETKNDCFALPANGYCQRNKKISLN